MKPVGLIWFVCNTTKLPNSVKHVPSETSGNLIQNMTHVYRIYLIMVLFWWLCSMITGQILRLGLNMHPTNELKQLKQLKLWPWCLPQWALKRFQTSLDIKEIIENYPGANITKTMLQKKVPPLGMDLRYQVDGNHFISESCMKRLHTCTYIYILLYYMLLYFIILYFVILYCIILYIIIFYFILLCIMNYYHITFYFILFYYDLYVVFYYILYFIIYCILLYIVFYYILYFIIYYII